MKLRPSLAAIVALSAVAALASGCGGRAHLEDDLGQGFRRAVAAQREAHPRKSVAPATATEVKIATANRLIRLNGSAVTPLGTSPGGGGYASGMASNAPQTSTTLNLSGASGGGGGGGAELRIQGK